MHTAYIRVLSGYLRIATGATRELGGRLLHRPALRSAGTVERVAGEVQVLCARADALIQAQGQVPAGVAAAPPADTADALPPPRAARGLRLVG